MLFICVHMGPPEYDALSACQRRMKQAVLPCSHRHPHACIEAKTHVFDSLPVLHHPAIALRCSVCCVPLRGHNMETLRDFVVVFDGSPGDSAPPENTCCRGVAFPRHFNLIGAFPPNLPLPDSAPPLHTAETASGRRRSLTQLHQSACCATSK